MSGNLNSCPTDSHYPPRSSLYETESASCLTPIIFKETRNCRSFGLGISTARTMNSREISSSHGPKFRHRVEGAEETWSRVTRPRGSVSIPWFASGGGRGGEKQERRGTTSIIRNPFEFRQRLAARSELGHRGPRRMEELDVEKPTGEPLSSLVHFPGGAIIERGIWQVYVEIKRRIGEKAEL